MTKLVLQTAATERPVLPGEVKEHLGITSSGSDARLVRLTDAAIGKLQQEHWTQFCEATYDQYADHFGQAPFILLRPPVGTVATVKYTDLDGNEQTVSTDVWEQGLVVGLGVVRLAYDQRWPTDCRGHYDNVVIRFTCGYGAAADVPEPIKLAILSLVEHLNEYRGEVSERTLSAVPKSLDYLMASYSYKGLG